MSIKDEINQDLKQAMRDKDTTRRDALRGLMAAIRQVEVDKRQDLSDDDIISILMTEAKRRRESIESYEEAGRGDDAEQEHFELEVIESYLPRQLSREEITDLVQTTIAEVGAASPQDIGKVMGALMPKVRGQADGRLVNEIVRQQLTGQD